MRIGEILKSKAGAFYLKLGQLRKKDGSLVGKNASEVFPITLANGEVLNEGDVLFLNDPRTEVDQLEAKNIISSEIAQQRRDNIKDFVKYNVVLSKRG